MIFNALRNVVIFQLLSFRDAHELWTKLQDKYGVSKICGDDCSPSSSGRVGFSTSSTSSRCGLPQGNARVSSGGHCNDDSVLVLGDSSSLSYCNGPYLDFNTSSTLHVSHARVGSPCIACRNCLLKSHDDMLAMSCCHDKNASIPRFVVLTM